jgi:hypothetical protein
MDRPTAVDVISPVAHHGPNLLTVWQYCMEKFHTDHRLPSRGHGERANDAEGQARRVVHQGMEQWRCLGCIACISKASSTRQKDRGNALWRDDQLGGWRFGNS